MRYLWANPWIRLLIAEGADGIGVSAADGAPAQRTPESPVGRRPYPNPHVAVPAPVGRVRSRLSAVPAGSEHGSPCNINVQNRFERMLRIQVSLD